MLEKRGMLNGALINSMKPKIIFIATPEFGAIVLNKLVEANLSPILVITAPDRPVGRKQLITPPPVKALAQKHNLPVIQPEKINEAKEKIQGLEPDLIVVAGYSQILPKEILDIPKYSSLNLHPSLLPRWRGPSPIEFTIIAGDKKTGVSLIKMTEKVDAGPIVGKTEIGLLGKETYQALHDKLGRLAGALLVETIPRWLEGEITPKEQDESQATYTKILKKEDGQIDWQKPVRYIERQIRALNPWPGAYTVIEGKIIKILKAEVLEKQGKECLAPKEIQMEGKKVISFEDFLRGYPDILKKIPQIC